MTPQAIVRYKQTHSQENILSANIEQIVIILIIAQSDIDALEKDVFLSCVSVCSCFSGWQNLPDTFIEEEEFIICQTFLLEDCYDSVVDAATYHKCKLVCMIEKMHLNPYVFCSLTVFGVPVPGGVGSCPLLLLPSVLW